MESASSASPSVDASQSPRLLHWLGAAAALMTAFAVRAANYPLVVGREIVVFAPGDAMYHVRRAYVSFMDFPRVLLEDAYVNHPDGAPIPWPPLLDILCAGLAALLGTDERGFELVMAWMPPVLGALTAVPVMLVARRIASAGTAIGAGFAYALIPIAVQYARVGNPDHHVAVSHLGAWMLLACAVHVERSAAGRSLLGPAVAMVALRLAFLFTWHGSLLYLGLVEATLLGAAIVLRSRSLAIAQALSLLATVALFAPILAQFPTPLLGPYSSIAPSRLHALALLAASVSAGALAFALSRRPELSLLGRVLAPAGAALAFAGGVLALPGPREGLAPALGFLGMSDAMGARTAEQFPLFSFGWLAPLGVEVREVSSRASDAWGAVAYLLPIAPLAAAWLGWRGRRGREAAWVCAAFAALFAWLAVLQLRYGNDAAPVVAVVLAASLGAGAERVRERLASEALGRFVPWAALALGALLFAGPILGIHVPKLARAAEARGEAGDGPRRSPAAALDRFLRDVREVTPETSGYLGRDSAAPEYGIVAHANLGHAIQWVARRPTPTDPFWSYIGPENWERAFGLLGAESEARALELAEELRARYVVTTPGRPIEELEGHLHATNGSFANGRPALERFRWVAEGPRGARTLHAIFARNERGIPDDEIPYKLFEIVEGAELEIALDPVESGLVVARVTLEGPSGRAFVWEQRARPDPGATSLRLRVPYPSRDGSPYAIRRGARRFVAEVGARDVVEGRRVVARPVAASASGR